MTGIGSGNFESFFTVALFFFSRKLEIGTSFNRLLNIILLFFLKADSRITDDINYNLVVAVSPLKH